MSLSEEIDPANADLHLRAGAIDTFDAAVSERDAPYETMSADDIRNLCTRRHLKLPSKANKATRIAALRKYDSVAIAYLEAMGRELPGTDGDRQPRRTRGCLFLLLNLLFSDEFCERFSETGTNQRQ